MDRWNTPVDKLPWYHRVWAKPLNWSMNKMANVINGLTELLRK